MTKESKPITLSGNGGEWETLLSEEAIKKRVEELGKEISEVYRGKKLLVIGVLRGAFVFTADIMRELNDSIPDIEVDFMSVTSYGDSETSSGAPVIEKDVSTEVKGWHVLLVEDIVDTGHSFKKIIQILEKRNPKSLRTCALLSKPVKREIQVPVDFLGFSIEDRFVVGYGLDSGQKGRARKDIIAKINKIDV